MRAATPVLRFGDGAAPEIIDRSCTGCPCRNEEEMIIAVADADQIDRRQCRAAAERWFSHTPMAASYRRPCHAIAERRQAAKTPPSHGQPEGGW